jgi:type IV secretory pathway component VirB8
MKTYAGQFGSIIREDTKKLQEIETKQDSHLNKTQKENDRIKKIEQETRGNWCIQMLTLLFAFVLFMFMMILIKLFPRH